jgi:hypothetical protein
LDAGIRDRLQPRPGRGVAVAENGGQHRRDDGEGPNESEPLVVGTSSRPRENAIGYPELKKWVAHEDRPFLLLFGTGWGLPPEVIERCDRMLEPVSGRGAYNHLSLRVAIGIVLDRILGDRGGEK